MSETTEPRRKKKPSRTAPRRKAKATAQPFVRPERRQEITGLLLATLGVLVALALVTYHPDDSHALETGAAFTPHNGAGQIGAWLADVLVAKAFGLWSLLVAGLMAVWGWALFRHRPLLPLVFPSVAALLGMIIGATFVGWWDVTSDADLLRFSGGAGRATATVLMDALGRVGSFLVLVLLMAVVALVFVEKDVQHLADHAERLLARIRDGLARAGRWLSERTGSAVARFRPDPDDDTPATSRKGETKPQPDENGPGTALPADDSPAAFDALMDRLRPDNDAPPWNDAVPELDADRLPAPPTEPLEASLRDETGDDLELTVQQGVEEARVKSLALNLDDLDAHLPYDAPPLSLLDAAPEGTRPFDPAEVEENKQTLIDKLDTYRIKITAINAIVGPTVTLYELTPAPGITINRIVARADDLAMAMAARGIRIIAPIPGKSAVGVEIPNRKRAMVRIADLIGTERFKEAKMELPFPIGKTIEGETFVEDLAKMPHVLVAGATGSGKSVGINTLIAGLLYRCHPSNLKFVFIDPKMVELSLFGRLRDHFIAMPEGASDPVVTDFKMALGVLKSCEKEMEQRYALLAKAQVRSVKDYNKRVATGALSAEDGHRHLPYIVVIVDELADLMMTAGKEIEQPIARLAQMARAIGIHLVLATQRPSVDVITGLIKANFPSRLAYQLPSKIDSRTIIDQGGAEQLLGNGDLLYMTGGRMSRLQGPFVSTEEVERLMDFIEAQDGPGPYWLPSYEAEDEGNGLAGDLDDVDDLFEDAARIIVRNQQGSVSLLQRKLSIGYGRASRIVDQLESAGIVGPFDGAKARAVLVASEVQLDSMLKK